MSADRPMAWVVPTRNRTQVAEKFLECYHCGPAHPRQARHDGRVETDWFGRRSPLRGPFDAPERRLSPANMST